MPAIEASIWLALRERVETLVTTPVLPVLWPGESTGLPQEGDPPAPVPCIEVSYLPNTVNRLFLKGSDPHQRPGLLQISLLTIPGGSHHETQVQNLGGAIAAHFPGGLRLFRDGLRVNITAVPTVSGSYRDGARNRWVTPITVRFETFA